MLLARRNQNYNQNWLPSLFNDFMNDDWFTTRTAASVPALNVIENEKDYELEFAVAHQIGHLTVTLSCHREPSRTYLTNGEGSDAIGTTSIEHLGEGRLGIVAVTENCTRIDMSNKRGIGTYAPGLGEVGLQANELGVGVLEQCLILLVEAMSAKTVVE